MLDFVGSRKNNEKMDRTRRLNPHAPPFYPSRFHHCKSSPPPPPPQHPLAPPPPRATSVGMKKSSARYSLGPVPTGPRNIRGGRCPDQRRFASAGHVSGCNDDRRDDGVRSWRRKGVYREITPLNPDEDSTSVMIRNIPNNYTRSLLVELLENHCKLENENEDDEKKVRSAFDFVYLPVDFKHRLNAGYAFVNFTSSDAAWRFSNSIKGKKWDLFESKKIADVARAKIQGKDALVRNFERMQLRSPSSEYLPVWFDPARDGSSSTMKMNTIGTVDGRC